MELDTEKGDDLETIRERLSEARRWFALAPPSFPRSPEIAPSHRLTEEEFRVVLPENRRDAVRALAWDRRRSLGNRAVGTVETGGRLLVYLPDENMADGGSEAYSAGFFDVYDEPPWDLWLGWIVEASGDQYLVSWIPSDFVETAQSGIDANPMDCIHWLPELEEPLGLRVP